MKNYAKQMKKINTLNNEIDSTIKKMRAINNQNIRNKPFYKQAKQKIFK